MKRGGLRWRLLWTIGLVVTLALVSAGLFLRGTVHRQIERQEVELEFRTLDGGVKVIERSFEEDVVSGPGVPGSGEMRVENEERPDARQVFFARLDRRLLWGFGTALVLTLVATWWLGRHILGPVEALTLGARRIAAGDLGQRIDLGAGQGEGRGEERRDEVGELASAFNAMAASLQRTDELRRNLVNDVAHELRTPLTRLRAQLEALLDGLAEPSDERLRGLLDDTVLLGRLVHDLEELARAEAGRLPLETTPVDVAEVLRDAVRAFDDGEQGAVLRLDLPCDLPCDLPGNLPAVRCDPLRVRQMVDNLLTNARTHTPPDGSIVVSAAESSTGFVEIAVRDTGPGLDAEARARVFERFYRGDPSRDRATGGTGLGLAIVAQLAAAQGGRAWVESAPGEGCRFAFVLPVAVEPDV